MQSRFLSLLMAAVLWLAGCARHAHASASAARARKILRVGNGAEPQDLDPQVVTGAPWHRHVQAFLAGLVNEAPHLCFDLWETGGGINDTNRSSPEYYRLLPSALDAPTTEARRAIYQQIERISLAEMSVMPVYFYPSARLVSPRVKHFFATPLAKCPWIYADLAA